MKKTKLAPVKVTKEEVRLCVDIGCGKNPKAGFTGLDALDFGQKYVHDVRKGLPFKANSVDEVHSSHFVEHLTWAERVPFFNELYRVMKPGATATIITPMWSHECFYGDPTHKEPMSQWYRLYLCKEWRSTQAPHVPYTCDFPINDQSCTGTLEQHMMTRNPEYQQEAGRSQINSTRDLVVTLKAKK